MFFLEKLKRVHKTNFNSFSDEFLTKNRFIKKIFKDIEKNNLHKYFDFLYLSVFGTTIKLNEATLSISQF